MKKKITMLCIMLLCFLTLVGCNSSKIREDNKKAKEEQSEKKKEKKSNVQTDASKFKQEYESLNGKDAGNDKKYRSIEIDEENPFVYAEAKDIIELIDKKETFIVYFGFSKCPWCRSVLPTLVSVAKDNGVDKIYYVDILDIRDTLELGKKDKVETAKEGTEDYYELLDKLDNVLNNYTLTNEKGKEIRTGEKRIYAPNVITVVNGKAKKITTGISDKQDDAYMELTDEIKKDTKRAFEKVIDEYTAASSVCDSRGDKC